MSKPPFPHLAAHHLLGLETQLRHVARTIARSRCPEVTHHAALLRFKQILAEEKITLFRERAGTDEWTAQFE